MQIAAVLLLAISTALLGSCSPAESARATRTGLEPGATAVTADHADDVRYADFSPDGRRLVTSSRDSTARLWDSDGKPVAVLEDGRSVRNAKFSPDGARIVAVADSADHTVCVWNGDGKRLAELAGHTNTVRSAVFSSDGSRILTTSMDSTARLWDRDGKPIAVLAGHTKPILSAELSSDGRRIVTTSADGTARLWDSEGRPGPVLAAEGVSYATFSPDGSRIATIAESKDHTVRLWDGQWKEIARLAGHTDSVRSVAFSADGRRIVTGSRDRTARIWSDEGEPLDVLEGHAASVEVARFSPDGSYVLTATDGRMGRLWNSDGELTGIVSVGGKLGHVAFDPEGSRIVATAGDGTARLFPVRDRLVPRRHGLETLALLRYEQGSLPHGMYNSGVRSILEDSNGHYWFGTWGDGVCRFDGESLIHFKVKDGLGHNQVRSIREDRTGVIWFDTGNGVSSYDGEKMITHVDRDYDSKNDWQLGSGDLWFCEDDAGAENRLEGQPGAYRYDGERLTFLAFPLPEERDGDWHYKVTGKARGKDGRLWISTYGSVIGYDGESFTFITNQSLGFDGSEGLLHVRSIFEDSLERLWIGNNGIGVLLRDGGATVNFTQQHGLGSRENRGGGPLPGDVSEGSPALDRVFAIGEDSAGSIWFGTTGHGAWRYDGESLRNFSAKDGLTSRGITAIYRDRRGDLWLGGTGVFKFNGESFDRVH